MDYNFDEFVDRKPTYSTKWNVNEGELPMWIADMDFKTAPVVRQALQKRLDNGIFGYTDIPEAWAQSYHRWWLSRHHFDMKEDQLIFVTGVIPALSSIVRKLTTPAEKVVLQTPVYNIFFNSVVNNGRQVLESPLHYEQGRYTVDFDDLEEKLSDPQTSLMVLCNPHNPTGQIWDKETLARLGKLCERYHVTVVSDEIHCDLTDPGYEYIPFASVNETCRRISITCMAPTKAFNIAGLNTAAVYISDPNLHHKVWRALNTDEVAEPNAFAMDATIAAFSQEGAKWLDQLRQYLKKNKETVYDFVSHNLPKVKLQKANATYLLWLDVSEYIGYGQESSDKIARIIREASGLKIAAGTVYGGNGRQFLRLNTACPGWLLQDGLNRLKVGLDAAESNLS